MATPDETTCRSTEENFSRRRADVDWSAFLVFRCIVGSQACGLSRENSDVDRRGVYLPPADLHWSLDGVPQSYAVDEIQALYWELQRFLTLALQANPTVLECLFSPLAEPLTAVGERLLALRGCFLSRRLSASYEGCLISELKRIERCRKNQSRVPWKKAMHLLRKVRFGTRLLRDRTGVLEVGADRDRLLEIRDGMVSWADYVQELESARGELSQAAVASTLPAEPNREAVGCFLIDARRSAVR